MASLRFLSFLLSVAPALTLPASVGAVTEGAATVEAAVVTGAALSALAPEARFAAEAVVVELEAFLSFPDDEAAAEAAASFFSLVDRLLAVLLEAGLGDLRLLVAGSARERACASERGPGGAGWPGMGALPG